MNMLRLSHTAVGLLLFFAAYLSPVLAKDNDALPVLMVISNQDFWYQDYGDTRTSLEAAGLEVVVAAATTEVASPHPARGARAVLPDLALADVNAEDYSAIVFSGGWGMSQYQYGFEGTYNNGDYRRDGLDHNSDHRYHAATGVR